MDITNILVVEDDPVVVELLYPEVRRIPNVSLDVCFSEAEAMQAIHRKSYALALVDIHLVDDYDFVGGIKVMERLNELKEGTALIVVSGTGEVDPVVSTVKIGVVDFLQKKKLQNGAKVVREKVEAFLQTSARHERNLLGNHDSLASMLSAPELIPVWEARLADKLNCPTSVLHAALENALLGRLPVLRPLGEVTVLTAVGDQKIFVGRLWSKYVGQEILLALSAPGEVLDDMPGLPAQELVYSRDYPSLSVRLWKHSGGSRDLYDDSIWSRKATRVSTSQMQAF